MTTAQGVRERHAVGKIDSLKSVAGNYGPQWELGMRYEFSNYPITGWVNDASNGSDDNRIFHPKAPTAPTQGESYPCILRRGDLSKPKDGKVRDGTLAWMYRWKMVEFNTTRPASDYPGSDRDDEVPGDGAGPARQQVQTTPSDMTTSAPAAQPILVGDERQRLIVQQNILNRATDLYIAATPQKNLTGLDRDTMAAAIKEIADELWAILPTIGQPPPDAPRQPAGDITPTEVLEREYHPADGPPDPIEEAEELPWDEPIAAPDFRDLKAFGRWAKDEHNLSSTAVVQIAQGIGYDIKTSLELTPIINDTRLRDAIIDAAEYHAKSP